MLVDCDGQNVCSCAHKREALHWRPRGGIDAARHTMDAAALEEWVALIVTAQSPAAPRAARDQVVALQNQVRRVGAVFEPAH